MRDVRKQLRKKRKLLRVKMKREIFAEFVSETASGVDSKVLEERKKITETSGKREAPNEKAPCCEWRDGERKQVRRGGCADMLGSADRGRERHRGFITTVTACCDKQRL